MRKNQILASFFLVLCFAILPFLFSGSYFLNIMTTFFIFAILACSLNLIAGYIGEISFGHAAFLGLGAYFTALLMVKAGLPFGVSLFIALVLTGAVSCFVGFLSLRLQGVHFAIVTLAFAEIFRLIVLNLEEVTRGAMGLSLSRPDFLSSDLAYYLFCLFFLILTVAFMQRFLSTPFGRSMVAIRESAALAQSLGVPVARYKIIVFTISGMIAALAGALYAPFTGIITPDLLSVQYTAMGLLMVIVGGKGYLLGPLYGAFIFTIIPEVLWMSAEMKLVVFGLILLLSILFMPKGVAQLIGRLLFAEGKGEGIAGESHPQKKEGAPYVDH